MRACCAVIILLLSATRALRPRAAAGARTSHRRRSASKKPALDAANVGGGEAPEEVRALLQSPPKPLNAAFAYELRFDGGCRGNPGPGGCGAILTKGGESVWAGWCALPDPETTNNVAEYSALLLGCDAIERYGVDSCLLVGDSKLVISQLTGAWQCRDERLKALRARALATLEGRAWDATHVARAENAHADALANVAMDSGGSGSSEAAGAAEPDVSAAAPDAAKAAARAYVDRLRAFADAEEARFLEEYGPGS
mmetsp:Transcript_9625/g.28795  ORF Transcript_9625/g.28795 Transcript_9625/m.28795 type:complete len:255 (-) Transcript_9625:26-790(-)